MGLLRRPHLDTRRGPVPAGPFCWSGSCADTATYRVEYAVSVAIGWTVLGVLHTVYLVTRRPEGLEDMERVYVEDGTEAPEPSPAFAPEA